MALLNDAPFLLSRARIGFPKAHTTEKRIFVFSALDALRQFIEAVHVATAEDYVIGNEGLLQLGDREDDFAFPFRLSEPFNSGNAEDIFDDIAVAIWKVAQLERHQGFFPNKRRAKSGPETEKQHSPAPITSQG